MSRILVSGPGQVAESLGGPVLPSDSFYLGRV